MGVSACWCRSERIDGTVLSAVLDTHAEPKAKPKQKRRAVQHPGNTNGYQKAKIKKYKSLIKSKQFRHTSLLCTKI